MRRNGPIVVAISLVLHSLAAGCAPTPAGHDAAVGRADAGPPTDAAPAGDAVDAAGPDELCNGLDDDGDGALDEGCPCTAGSARPCFAGDPAQAGVGACALGSQACIGGDEFAAWGSCTGSGAPAVEACGGAVDDDCDGQVDEGCCTNQQIDDGAGGCCWPPATPLCGVGSCGNGYTTCWPGHCADPEPDGDCCSGFWSTTHAAADGSYTEAGYNWCD